MSATESQEGIKIKLQQMETLISELEQGICDCQNILNSSRDVIWAMNTEKQTTFISPSVYNLTGYSPEEYKKLPLKNFLTSESYQKYKDNIHEAYRKYAFDSRETLNAFEISIIRKSGEIRRGEVIINPLFSQTNEFIGIVGIIRDVTLLKELRQNRDLLASILEETEDLAFVKDLNHRYIAVNKAFLRGTGKSNMDEVLGKTILEISGIKTDFLKVWSDDNETKKLKKGEHLVSEQSLQAENGDDNYFLVKKFPVYDKQDKLQGIACIARNITIEKQANNKVSESFRKLEIVINAIGEGLTLSNFDGFFELYNPKMEEYTGYSKEEANNSPDFIDKIYPERQDRDKVYADLSRLSKEKGTNVTEVKMRSKSGVWRDISVYTKIVVFNNKEYFLTVYSDITQRKKDDAKLRQSENDLREMNNTKDKFFSIIAHDLKNPINAISGFSDLLLQKLDTLSVEKLEKYVKVISDSANKTQTLLENLLEWARVQTGRIPFKATKIDLRELIVDASQYLAVNFSAKQLKLSIEAQSTYFVHADGNMIKTIVRNLLSNAIKFSFRNSEVKVDIKDLSSFVQVDISDFGMGISPENMDKIFRIDAGFSTKGTERESGTGLGLIICKEFVEYNKGQIWVNSEEGKYTTFSFTLPKYMGV